MMIDRMVERFKDHSTPMFPEFSEALKEAQKFAKGKRGEAASAAANEVLLGKTAIGRSDFGGTYDLAIDQEDGFWDKVIDYSQGLNNVAVKFTNANKVPLSELTLGTNGEDIWRPGVEGTDPGDTTTVDTAEVVFVPEETVAIVQIADSILEDTIERGTLEQHILGMMQRATANEWEDFAYNGYMVGSTNSSRGSVTGCFDGFIKLFDAGGNVINAADYADRYVDLDYSSNDKHIAALKLLPEKYGQDDIVNLTPRTLAIDAAGILGPQRATPLGDQYTSAGYRQGVLYAGVPWFVVPKMRTNYIVKGTGTKAATTPGDTQLNGITKARATTSTVDSISNFAANAKTVIGATASAGAAFNLNAEYRLQSGTPSGTTLTWASALTYDHADNEYVVEYDVAPTLTGIANLLTSWDNLRIASQRLLRIETYREPRKRATSFVLSARWCPVVINPDKGVLIRDLAKKV